MEQTGKVAPVTKKRANAVVEVEQAGDLMSFTVEGEGEAVLDLTRVSAVSRTRAMWHGFKQRVSDAAAIQCDPQTGKPASPAEKFAALAAVVEHLNSGSEDWNLKRAAGERTGNVLQAFANVYGFTIEKARTTMEAFAAKRGIEYGEALKIWRGSDKILDELARMARERPSVVDADSLLDELGELDYTK